MPTASNSLQWRNYEKHAGPNIRLRQRLGGFDLDQNAGTLRLKRHDGENIKCIEFNQADTTNNPEAVKIANAGTGNDLHITNTNGGALGPKIELYHNVGNSAAADDDVVGRILVSADDEEASATQRDLFQLDVQWTDATAASYASDLEIYLATSAAQNLALTLSGGGQLGLDLDSDLSSSSSAGEVFDDYDDAKVLKKYAHIGVDNPEISRETVQFLEEIGVVEKNEDNQRGYVLLLQPFLRLICGGIYQTRQWVDELKSKVSKLEQLAPA